ncbi:hypothetical protein H6771_02095 [Candidatus Peribacteria bacterium]|nr:hypothetical protein [Candidatus Peribacteria bacterium]
MRFSLLRQRRLLLSLGLGLALVAGIALAQQTSKWDISIYGTLQDMEDTRFGDDALTGEDSISQVQEQLRVNLAQKNQAVYKRSDAFYDEWIREPAYANAVAEDILRAEETWDSLTRLMDDYAYESAYIYSNVLQSAYDHAAMHKQVEQVSLSAVKGIYHESQRMNGFICSICQLHNSPSQCPACH